MCTHEVSFHTPVSELCERITVCKWIYSCKQVISVSPQPYKKRKTKTINITYMQTQGGHGTTLYMSIRQSGFVQHCLCTSQCCMHIN